MRKYFRLGATESDLAFFFFFFSIFWGFTCARQLRRNPKEGQGRGGWGLNDGRKRHGSLAWPSIISHNDFNESNERTPSFSSGRAPQPHTHTYTYIDLFSGKYMPNHSIYEEKKALLFLWEGRKPFFFLDGKENDEPHSTTTGTYRSCPLLLLLWHFLLLRNLHSSFLIPPPPSPPNLCGGGER